MAANLKLTAKEDAFVASMKKAQGAVGAFAAEINIKLNRSLQQGEYHTRNFDRGFGKLGETMKSVGSALTLGVTLPLGLLAKASSDAYAEFDALKRALSTVEPTAAGLKGKLMELREIAKAPGIGFAEAIQGEVRLRSVGVSASVSTKVLKEFANAIAMTGGGKAQLNEVTLQLAQMYNKGKVMAQDFRSIMENAPAIGAMVKEMFGTTDSDAITKHLESMGKGSVDFINMLLTEMEKAPRVTGGWKNALENLTDTLFVAKAELFEVADNAFNLQGKIQGAGDAVQSIVEKFKSLEPNTQATILGFIAFVGVLPPLTYGLGALAVSIKGLVFALQASTLGIGAAIAGIVALGFVLVEIKAKQDAFVKATEPLSTTLDKANVSAKDTIATMNRHIKTLETAKVGSDRWKRAKEELIAIDPKFKELLSGDIINFDKLKIATNGIAENIIKIAKAKQLQAKADSIMSQLETYKKGSDRWDNVNTSADFIFWTAGKKAADNYLKTIKEGASNQVKDLGKALGDVNLEMQKLNVGGKKLAEDLTTPKVPLGGGSDKKGKEKTAEDIAKERQDAWDKFSSSLTKELADDRQKISDDFFNKIGMMADAEGLYGEALKMDEKAKEEMFSRKNSFAEMLKPEGQTDNADFMSGYLGGIDEVMTQAEMDLQSFQQRMGEMAANIGVDFATSLGEGLASGEGIGGAFRTLFSNLGNMLMQYGTKALMASVSIEKFNKLFNIIPGSKITQKAAIGIIGAGILTKSLANIPKLAQGGVSKNPTLAMIGDNKSGREMVLPFERTGEFANMIASSMGGVGGGTLEARISGNDLLILLDRAKRSK